MLITLDDPLSLFINVIDKETGKSFSDLGIYITEWDTATKSGLKEKEVNGEWEPVSLPNSKSIIKIPKGRFNEELIAMLISKEKDVELIIDN